MIQLPLSQTGPADQFAKLVEDHRAALEAHRVGRPGICVPIAHRLIEGLIVRKQQEGPVASRGPDQFVIAPYEIIDDTPPPAPPPTLAERKMTLQHQVNNAAQEARDAIMSPAKAQLVAMDASDAIVKPEDMRSPAESAVIELYSQFQSHCADIQRATLRATVEIEDLAESTIDGWKIPSF